jgi:hypothetical protein
MVKWERSVARMEVKRNLHCVLMGNPEEKGPFDYLRVDKRTIVRWILKK